MVSYYAVFFFVKMNHKLIALCLADAEQSLFLCVVVRRPGYIVALLCPLCSVFQVLAHGISPPNVMV